MFDIGRCCPNTSLCCEVLQDLGCSLGWWLWPVKFLFYEFIISLSILFLLSFNETDRNSVHWSMLNLHPLPRADEVSRDVVVGGQYQMCCCWRSLDMHMTVAVVQTAPHFCFWSGFVFSLWSDILFIMLADWWLSHCQISNMYSLIIGSSLNSIDWNHEYEKNFSAHILDKGVQDFIAESLVFWLLFKANKILCAFIKAWEYPHAVELVLALDLMCTYSMSVS